MLQADYTLFPYLNGTGITQFPAGRAVPGPNDGDLCRHTGGLPLGMNYTLATQVRQRGGQLARVAIGALADCSWLQCGLSLPLKGLVCQIT